MDEQTRYAQERSQGARRPLQKLTTKVAQWAQGSSNKFVGQAWNLVGVLADAIRSGQYDLGVPFIYSKTMTLAGGTSDVLTLNVKKFGVIQHIIPVVSNSDAAATDPVMLAGVTRIEIGAQTFWEQQDGTLITPSITPGRYAAGFAPVVGGVSQPGSHLGFLRRIPVAQGDVIEAEVRNIGSDDYQVGLVVVQYGMLPPALGR